jgi:hypothetical protein
MSAYMVHLHAPDMTAAQYEQLYRQVSVDRSSGEGVISQMGGPTDDGWCLVTVFQTQEMAERYVREKLTTALADIGVALEPELIPTLNLQD